MLGRKILLAHVNSGFMRMSSCKIVVSALRSHKFDFSGPIDTPKRKTNRTTKTRYTGTNNTQK